MLPRPASTSLFQHGKWLYVIEAAQPGLDPKVLFVYFLRSGRRIGTDEGIVVRSEVTTPESGIT
jgi:hypothetical protein